MGKSRVFGGKCTESLGSYDLESSSWRTSQLSLFEEVSMSLDRLPRSGTMRNGVLSPLVISGPLIEEIDGSAWRGLLPTPQAIGEICVEKKTQRALQLAKKNLPLMSRKMGKRTQFGIIETLMYHKNLPTPLAHYAKVSPSAPSRWKRQTSLNVEAAKMSGYTRETIGKDMRLHPHFVEWMMGFPIGYTDLKR